jgi:hypothetical protein
MPSPRIMKFPEQAFSPRHRIRHGLDVQVCVVSLHASSPSSPLDSSHSIVWAGLSTSRRLYISGVCLEKAVDTSNKRQEQPSDLICRVFRVTPGRRSSLCSRAGSLRLFFLNWVFNKRALRWGVVGLEAGSFSYFLLEGTSTTAQAAQRAFHLPFPFFLSHFLPIYITVLVRCAPSMPAPRIVASPQACSPLHRIRHGLGVQVFSTSEPLHASVPIHSVVWAGLPTSRRLYITGVCSEKAVDTSNKKQEQPSDLICRAFRVNAREEE